VVQWLMSLLASPVTIDSISITFVYQWLNQSLNMGILTNGP
jgi:hypothetical protein